MAGLPRYLIACLHTGRLAFLAIMVSGGIVLQVLVSNDCKVIILTHILLRVEAVNLTPPFLVEVNSFFIDTPQELYTSPLL